ncbi:hypothetical protein G9C98_006292, partial [Cotesia typhae]
KPSTNNQITSTENSSREGNENLDIDVEDQVAFEDSDMHNTESGSNDNVDIDRNGTSQIIFDETLPVIEDGDLFEPRNSSSPLNLPISHTSPSNVDQSNDHYEEINNSESLSNEKDVEKCFEKLWPESNSSSAVDNNQIVTVNVTLFGSTLDAEELFKAKDVTTMRMYANHVIRAMWPLEKRKKLVLSERAGRQKEKAKKLRSQKAKLRRQQEKEKKRGGDGNNVNNNKGKRQRERRQQENNKPQN